MVIKELVNSSLLQAERHWANGGNKLILESVSGEEELRKSTGDAAPSNIPGYKIIQEGETIVDDFIAIVVDMRESTKHMLVTYRGIKINGIQRLFFETSALLPALEKTINFQGGGVTEYLGDGVLGFFKKDKEDPKKYVYDAYQSAIDCIGDTLEIVNDILFDKYELPPLSIGVGMASSKALISLSGIQGNKHAKAYGQCVFRATKLSGGNNAIMVDEMLRGEWPSSKNGNLSFKEHIERKSNVKGYRIEKK